MQSRIPEFKNMALNRINFLVPHVTKLMGMALVLYALLCAYTTFNAYGGTIPIANIAAVYFVIAMGTLILIDFSFNLSHAIGWYAIAIGGNRLLRFSVYLNPPKGLSFVFSLVMIAISINLCITGLTYLKGSVRGYFMMKANTIIMLLLNISALFYLKNTGIMTFEEILVLHSDSIALIVMYIMLLCMISSKPIRMSSNEERYDRILHALKVTLTYKKDTHISLKDAEILANGFSDRSGWTAIDDGGPAECEYKFRFKHTANEYAYMTVQKWKDSDRLYFSLSSNDGASMIYAYRFYADKIFFNNSDGKRYLLIFNKEGLYMRLLVSNDGVTR